jgi:hypothetical protein
MSTLTLQIKLINRVSFPHIPEGYKRSMKIPVQNRNSQLDHLNVFSKTVSMPQEYFARDIWANELASFNKLLHPFHLAVNPTFGDKLVGCFTTREYDEFYIEIYHFQNWIF